MWIEQQQISKKTRMHSSRMRTAYFNGHLEGDCLWVQGVFGSGSGGVCLWVWGCLPSGSRGCLPLDPRSIPWQRSSSGQTPRGADTPRQIPPLGKHPQADTLLGQTPLADTPWANTRCPIAYWDKPPVNRITDRCKNITFPQLCLRAVTIHFRSESLPPTFTVEGR